jgi:hypothetical protein
LGARIVALPAQSPEVHADFADAIEPSSTGGAKIAEAICAVVTRHDFGQRHVVLFP